MRRTRTSGWYSRLRGEQAGPWRAHRLGGLCRLVMVAAVALVWLANPGLAADEPAVSLGRVETAQKGSLLILSAVELRWAEDGSLVQDTFIELYNDHPDEVDVQLYFVNGDGPLTAGGGEPAHPGWNREGVGFRLSGNEPTYWSAFSGEPRGFPSWTILDPGTPEGRPDPDGSTDRVLRGYVVCWAVDTLGREIRWNHLGGMATVVDYRDAAAWEYPAWAFQAHGANHGDQTRSCLTFNLENGQCIDHETQPGEMNLDGYEYDVCPGALMFEFRAAGSTLPAPEGGTPIGVDTRLVLFPCDLDLRQDTEGPVVTKAHFDIWNQEEVQLTGTHRCIIGWDMTPLESYTPFGVPNSFLREFLQTDRGVARIHGMASGACNVDGWVSQDAALLGVVQSAIRFPGMVSQTGIPLSIQSKEIGRIQADIGTGAGERPRGVKR